MFWVFKGKIWINALLCTYVYVYLYIYMQDVRYEIRRSRKCPSRSFSTSPAVTSTCGSSRSPSLVSRAYALQPQAP